MRRKSQLITAAVVALILAVSFFTAYSLWRGNTGEVDELTNISVTISSWAVSVVALVVALVTYFSIDSVNTLTSMNGNVLENERYTIAYRELVRGYDGCHSREALEEAVFGKIEVMLKENSSTCMQFTDSVQYIVDNILWFAYLDSFTERFSRRRSELIAQLEKRMKRFSSLSNGNLYLLNENIKLIKNVLGYQNMRQGVDRGMNTEIDLLDIRARTICNPVTQTVYYDYLGLEFRSRAAALIKEHCGMSGDEFLPSNIKKMAESDFSDIKHETVMLLKRSVQAFEKAAALSDEDILWNGYIRFNTARAQLLCALTEKTDLEPALMLLGEALEARYVVMYIFAQEKDAYLSRQFRREYIYCDTMRMCFAKAGGRLTPDDRRRVKEYLEVCESSPEPEVYARIKSYLKELSE